VRPGRVRNVRVPIIYQKVNAGQLQIVKVLKHEEPG